MTNMETRILYVEDDESACEIVRDLLAREGFTVRTARDGEAAMEILEKETFHVVLLDIRMPGKDGLQVLTEMRERKITPRVIMLTGVADVNTAIDAVKRGANDYITKPYGAETLLSCIRRVLAR